MSVENELTEELLLSMKRKVGKFPPDPDDKNHSRAEAAFRAVRTFSQDFGEDINNFEGEEQLGIVWQNAKDLFTDVAHLCDRLAFDFNSLLDRAKIQYHDETQQKGRQFHFLNELENLRALRDSL